ncbi:hypothetical protein QYE76_056007 [Lolium multiflorum]|uniref:Retrotransposon gag domain-containing protein n=1 Tax=Lolium multiflorum TaxID=4521 RepID=A0AAD8T2G1_LOLMU|nr:hypothetical protein QYE76_056007 [Lolium multiflorum]
MGKPRDTKIAILPSTTRKGTILSTSATLDSPSVIDKLVSPPHASHAGTSAESEHSHNIDNVSAVLDDSGSLGSFLDATIAKSRQIENTETPNATTPVSSPELDYFSDDLEEDYVELDDDFIEKCNATTDARKIKKLLAEHVVRYKLSPDPKFATSPINIRDKDYDFSLDLSHIAIVEKTPFCGTEKESAVEHMTELSTLSSLFSDDVKKRTYFVAKIFPFSLKDDAKTWYNNLPPSSIKSPKELLAVFFRKYFPASAQHAALQRVYNFDQGDEEKLPEAWARFCSLIRALPDHDLEKHDLLDIFYSGLTIESRAYLDSCAGCVFRKRTPDEAEELLAKIGRNYDDWNTPEPTPTPIVKKRGLIKLNDEDMREAKKSLRRKLLKCLILTDFVVLEMPEDDNMSIILGRPFLNTAGAVIDCNKGKVTFNVDDKEHTVYFPKKIDKHRTCDQKALRAVARRDLSQPQLWVVPGSTVLPVAAAGGFRTSTHSGTPVGPSSTSTTSPSTSEMADGTPVTYEDLTDELKKKYDEVKTILEADLIGSFHRTVHMASGGRGSRLMALDGIDLSTPSEERTQVPAAGD